MSLIISARKPTMNAFARSSQVDLYAFTNAAVLKSHAGYLNQTRAELSDAGIPNDFSPSSRLVLLLSA